MKQNKNRFFSSLVLFQRLMSKTVEFKDLTPSLLPEILDVLQEMNFKTPTPVQGKVIPYFLSHKDVNVSACTGSGKTLSFLIPVFQIIQSKKDSLRAGEVGGIVISPKMKEFDTDKGVEELVSLMKEAQEKQQAKLLEKQRQKEVIEKAKEQGKNVEMVWDKDTKTVKPMIVEEKPNA